jgi:branched-chain amino acid transport system ATP-binding protein
MTVDAKAAPNILVVSDIRKQFGGLAALDGLDFAVPRNKIFGLIGPNGSGKTTMLNVLTGVLPPTAGHIRFESSEIAGLSSHRIASFGISRTFQNIRLFKKMSVLDNVKVGAHIHARYGLASAIFQLHRRAEKEIEKKAEEALAFVGLSDRRHRLAGTLPYGEQRLVEIARAVCAKPSLLLLDEPLVGMPPAEIDRVVRVFHAIVERGTTIILVEHTMRVVMSICDEIAVLNFGRRIAQGTPAEIRKNEDVITAYLGKSH